MPKFESVILLNNGGNFEIQKLPNRAQISPANGIVVSDFDGDQNGDILLAGNSFVSEVETGNADAGVGLFMKGDGKGGFIVESPEKSGFCAIGDVKNMSLLKRTYIGKPCIIIANNNTNRPKFLWLVMKSNATYINYLLQLYSLYFENIKYYKLY